MSCRSWKEGEMLIWRRVPRALLTFVLAATAAGVLVAAVSAGTVIGTARNDVLKGTLKNDKIYGKAGNDRMFGYAGNDVLTGGPGNDTLVGGPGNDTLVGGPGADVLNCGPGQDVAQADATDTVNKSCETVKGLPKPPALTIADAATAEGDSATKVLSFPVTLSAVSTKPVTVSFATADGTATAGSDYVAASGTLTFDPGEKAKTVDITINGETTLEPDESLTVNLSNPVNATIADGSATGTIQNDDHSPSPHPGHYAGTTSNGSALGFDVAGDGSAVANLTFTVHSSCFILGTSPDLPITVPGPVSINADRSFSTSFSGGRTDLSANGTIEGSFDASGNASGALKATTTVTTDSGPFPCPFDVDLTWTAQ
jgi:hypothetical protein